MTFSSKVAYICHDFGTVSLKIFLVISLNSLVDFPSPFAIKISFCKSSLTLFNNLVATATFLNKNLNIG